MAEPLTPATLASEAATDTAAEVAGDALRLLRRSLQRSRGFALLLCVCELPTARNQFIAQLGAAMPDVELITIDAADPGPAGFSGSVIIADFESLEAARAWAEADPYTSAGVYADVVVKPFRQTLP